MTREQLDLTPFNKAPKLRFPEFQDAGDWEEKKLGEVVKIERGRFSPRPRNDPKYYGGEIPFVQTSDVVNSKGRIREYSQTLNHLGLRVSKLFPKGSLLITIAANIGYAGVLERDMACPDSLIGLTCSKDLNNYFLNYILEIEQSKMDYLAVEAAQKNINIEFLKPYKIDFPTLPEQQKIAAFLSSVDTKITQLTQKKTLLERYKKGVMQKLFSQELRFKDAQGKEFPEWVEKRLGEMAVIIMGSSPKSKFYNQNTEGLPLIQGNADIRNRKSAPRIYSSVVTKECMLGDILLSVRAPVGEVSISVHHACIGRGMSAVRANQSNNQEYIFQFLLWFEPRWASLSQGSTFEAVNTKDIKLLAIPAPSKVEQQKIADFLSAIDRKIDLITTELTHAQTFKKGLLQQMFI